MATQTTTIETVSVVRPLKVISFICLLIAICLLLTCIATNSWLKSGGYKFGLFRECTAADRSSYVPGAPPPGKCQKLHRQPGDFLQYDCSELLTYIKAVTALLIIATILLLVALTMNGLGLCARIIQRKYTFYKIATYFALFSVLLDLISLIVFPACFYGEMKEHYGAGEWEFDWSYGIAWGATLFTFGAALLLICDKEHEEVCHKVKTVYNPPPELGAD
uniref:Lipoma HMGIC fusion partner-like 2 protein n=1 Tax=Syphacia muris TaxID=451379 RepID=A0A0N5ANJ7_9BILA